MHLCHRAIVLINLYNLFKECTSIHFSRLVFFVLFLFLFYNIKIKNNIFAAPADFYNILYYITE